MGLSTCLSPPYPSNPIAVVGQQSLYSCSHNAFYSLQTTKDGPHRCYGSPCRGCCCVSCHRVSLSHLFNHHIHYCGRYLPRSLSAIITSTSKWRDRSIQRRQRRRRREAAVLPPPSPPPTGTAGHGAGAGADPTAEGTLAQRNVCPEGSLSGTGNSGTVHGSGAGTAEYTTDWRWSWMSVMCIPFEYYNHSAIVIFSNGTHGSRSRRSGVYDPLTQRGIHTRRV